MGNRLECRAAVLGTPVQRGRTVDGLTDEQRRHIQLALSGLNEEADDADAAELARRAFVLATAIAPGITAEELTHILVGVRDVTELRPG